MKTNKLKSIIIVVAMVLTAATTSYAQSKHHVGEVGKGPHGGTVQEADPYHGEINIKAGKVYFYLLDGDAKPMRNPGITGKALLQFADGKTISKNLVANGTDGFIIQDNKAANYVNCIVTVMVKGKSVSAKFKNYITGKK